ncbi:MAG TPA: hypothetical protein VFG36_06645 [Methanoregula sp.]|nr:hypothetical protein [Methanoregula sp.]
MWKKATGHPQALRTGEPFCSLDFDLYDEYLLTTIEDTIRDASGEVVQGQR